LKAESFDSSTFANRSQAPQNCETAAKTRSICSDRAFFLSREINALNAMESAK
jgi:hypothetical protein